MIYCFDKKLQFDYSKSEMAITRKNGNGILYDGRTQSFETFDGEPFDIEGKVIFPRTGVLQIKDMTDDIVSHSGIPIISNEETEMIENWPEHYKTQRRTIVLKGKDLLDEDTIKSLKDEYGENIFIKTVKKNFSGVIPVSLLQDSECAFYKALSAHLDDSFMVSEAIDLSEDKHGKKEYRCFVIGNKPYNISRFTTDIFHEIDEDVLRRLEEIVEEMKGRFPSCYVVDLLEYEKDGNKVIDVSEFNPPQAAGLYLYNSVLEESSDMLHALSPKRIAKEFMMNYDCCRDEGTVINTREPVYGIPESFANDLRSICLIGEPGLSFVADIDITPNCYASHKALLAFEPFRDEDTTSIMSDRDLSDNGKPKEYVKKEEN